jgi:hypothetical protein
MYRWKTAVGPTVRNTKILVTDPDGHELLKAVLLTLLEGLALWAGHPLTAVISAGPALPQHVDEALFGGALVPVDSALVRFDVAPRVPRRRTLRGLGDFRQLRLVQRRWA